MQGTISVLGTGTPQGSNNGFKNGSPNALNMMLWKELISKLAENIGRSCRDAAGPKGFLKFKFNPSFETIMMEICKWPAPVAKSEDVLLRFWVATVQFDAPKSEFDAFRDCFLDTDSPYAREESPVTVAAIVKAGLLNPYFLLEHK